MKQSFWAKIAFKNIFENKKFHLANLVVNVFTVTTLYLYIFMATNPGLSQAPGYETLKLVLYLGCVFLAIITLVFKSYTNRIFVKRRNKELGLYAVWGLETKHINSILRFEALYMYIVSVALGLILGFISQHFMYDSLFKLMKCNTKYDGKVGSNAWFATMIIFFIIDVIILLKNMKTIRKQKVITLLKAEDSNKIVKKLGAKDILGGIFGVALIIVSYIYVNRLDDLLNSISNIFIVIAILFVGSYFVISSFVVMVEFFLKKKDNIYYRNTFFTTIAKLISRTRNNALSLTVINILFTCVIIGASTTIALYLGTERQASTAYKDDGEICVFEQEQMAEVEDTIREVAAEQGLDVKLVRSYDVYTFPTIFDETSGKFGNDVAVTRNLPDLIYIIDLDDYNKYEGTNLTLGDDEAYFISDEIVPVGQFDSLDIYGKKIKVKEVLEGPAFCDSDNIKYAYSFKVVVKDYAAIEDWHEYISNLGNDRDLFHYVSYVTSGDKDQKSDMDVALAPRLRKLGTVTFFDSNATQRRTRYARNAIFLFLGAFISLIFILYMIFIMYYKQIQEAIDDTENVKIMQKVGMSDGEVKKCILTENGILFFIPILMAFGHVAACFGIICDVLKLFMLSDISFTRLCIIVFCAAITAVYMLMYYGAYRVYTSIVLKAD